MFFRSIYLKTVRDYRVPILGWGLGLGVLIAAVVAAVPSVLATPAARASIVALGPSFAWFAEPVQIDTAGGYATWKYGLTLLVAAIFPILAQTATLRGEEERGSLDVLLSVPRTRLRVALEKVAAMWTALLAMGLVIGLFAFAGAAKTNADFGLGGAVLFGLNLALVCGVFGAVALLISQFTQERRAAAGWTAGVLFVSIVVDMVHRVIPNTVWLSAFSPVYYYNLSKPLVPSYGTNVGAVLVMVVLSVVLTAAAVRLFVRRDIGGVVARPGVARLRQTSPPRRGVLQGQWSLRSVYTRSLAMIAMPTFWWTLAIAGFAGWMVIVVKQTEKQLSTILQSSGLMKDFLKLGGSDMATNATLLSALFVFVPLLLMAFAVTQANRWSSDEEDGRLELVLSTPQPRLGVLLGRFAALATAAVVISVLTLASTAVAALASGLALDWGNLAAATLSIIPLGLLVAAIGYLFAGWLRTAVETGLLSFLLVIWFVISFIGPGLNWPEPTLRLSALYYYGTPLLNGLPVFDTLVVVAAGVVALSLASARFVRKDIGR
ncbi:MAG TPA: ABC transporter permease subunit [Candidatus Dormibacteraeota bacterium]|nr:ABC transporter permease subunit [Candidatus Dormibacteraeota bacterium]